jgi:hypothetical protein
MENSTSFSAFNEFLLPSVHTCIIHVAPITEDQLLIGPLASDEVKIFDM